MALLKLKKDSKEFKINIHGNIVFLINNGNIIEVLNKTSDQSGNIFFLSRLNNKFGLLDEDFNVIIKNNIYGKFEVIQRINENTFLIKMVEKEFFIDCEGNFK